MIVAGLSAGLVAAVTFLLAREYRWRNLRSTAIEETHFALAVAPFDLDPQNFERFTEIYTRRSDAHILAVRGSESFSSADLVPADVPSSLRRLSEEPSLVQATVDGRPTLVAGAVGRDGVHYYLFFSLEQLQAGLKELAQAAVVSWLATIFVAGAVGWFVARRTLRPVARVASAAESIAAGDLGARLPDYSNDEFGTLARSFNHMADEVQRLIVRLEAAAERERQFSADVAHELRTPLTGMAAASSLLADELDQLPSSACRPAEILIHDVHRLRTLVSELLELAALESAPGEVDEFALGLHTAVETVVADAETRRAAPLHLDVPDDLEVLCEPSGLRRILANLIDNAIKHGRGDIVVAAAVDESGAFVVLDVVDDGPGIATDELPRVFDRFHKADRSRSGGGSGLGLAIAKQHAVHQGGDLSVVNEPGHGARFSLRLRRATLRRDEPVREGAGLAG